MQGIGGTDSVLEGDVDQMSDADVPSLGFVVGSADDIARLSVALRHSSCDSETEVLEDEEHGDVFQLGANIERPQPVTKSSAKDRHAAGARPAPAQCKCTNVRVSDSVCPLVPKRLAIKVNFRQGRLVVFGSLPEDEDIGRASRQIAFSRLRYGRLCGSELVICASIIPFFWRRLQRHRDNAIQPTLSTKRVAYEWVRCDDFTPDKAGSTWATWRFTIPTARLVVSLTHTYI